VSSPSVAGAAIRHPTLADYLHLIGLSLIWGSSFLAIKIAVEHGVPPLTVAAFRIGLGAALLLTIARLRGHSWPPMRTSADARFWGRLLFLGVVGNSLPFFLQLGRADHDLATGRHPDGDHPDAGGDPRALLHPG
jgi:drug/metabolite transporter (DMT)-like permease